MYVYDREWYNVYCKMPQLKDLIVPVGNSYKVKVAGCESITFVSVYPYYNSIYILMTPILI